MKRLAIIAVLVFMAAAGAAPAEARVIVGVGVGVGCCAYPYPAYYPYYDYPAYYPPPGAVYMAPPPVVYAQPSLIANQASPTFVDGYGRTCRQYQGAGTPTVGTACIGTDGVWRAVAPE